MCIRDSPEPQNRDSVPDWREHLRGRVAWAAQLNPLKARRLQVLYERIEWAPDPPSNSAALSC